jgi:hypothetical protein
MRQGLHSCRAQEVRISVYGLLFLVLTLRRRHELNHNPEALYRCTQTGCKKSFHRSDLLARHMERQYAAQLVFECLVLMLLQ